MFSPKYSLASKFSPKGKKERRLVKREKKKKENTN